MTSSKLYEYWKLNLSCIYNGRFLSFRYVQALYKAETAYRCIQDCNWDFATWLEKSRKAGHLLIQAIHGTGRRIIEWDGIEWNDSGKVLQAGPFTTDFQQIKANFASEVS